jgi:hypothetical protein
MVTVLAQVAILMIVRELSTKTEHEHFFRLSCDFAMYMHIRDTY